MVAKTVRSSGQVVPLRPGRTSLMPLPSLLPARMMLSPTPGHPHQDIAKGAGRHVGGEVRAFGPAVPAIAEPALQAAAGAGDHQVQVAVAVQVAMGDRKRMTRRRLERQPVGEVGLAAGAAPRQSAAGRIPRGDVRPAIQIQVGHGNRPQR